MPWPSEWDDDGAVDERPPRRVLDLDDGPEDLDRRPRWDVDEIGDSYE